MRAAWITILVLACGLDEAGAQGQSAPDSVPPSPAAPLTEGEPSIAGHDSARLQLPKDGQPGYLQFPDGQVYRIFEDYSPPPAAPLVSIPAASPAPQRVAEQNRRIRTMAPTRPRTRPRSLRPTNSMG